MPDEEQKDFFVSYNHTDEKWASWIAWELEQAGYTVIYQAWDFRPGNNFVHEMDKALRVCERVMPVLSPKYLKSDFANAEWKAKFIEDASGEKRKIIPVRVAECELEGLLPGIIYIDLVALDEEAARARLLSGIMDGRSKPSTQPLFPGKTPNPPPIPPVAPKPHFPGDLPAYWNIPAKNPDFTGRDSVIEDIHRRLLGASATAISQPQAISGLGGIGKTQTALAYAYRYGGHYPGGGFWVKADTESNLVSGLSAIAQAIGMSLAQNADQTLIVDAVKQWMRVNRDWLLILDNAADPVMIKRHLPETYGGRILITTRLSELDRLGVPQPIELHKMPADEAETFLWQRTQRLANDPAEKQAARDLADALDYLPLALEQAAAFIIQIKTTFANYLSRYQKRSLALLEQGRPARGDYEATVATTWQLNFDEVDCMSPAASAVLYISAFLAADDIPTSLIVVGAKELGDDVIAEIGNDGDLLDVDLLLVPLLHFSLISKSSSNTYSIHRLVQSVVKKRLEDYGAEITWAKRAIAALSSAYPIPEYGNWSVCEDLLPHALACTGLIGNSYTIEIESAEAGLLLDNTGQYLSARARFREADELFKYAVIIRERVLGPLHADTSMSLHNLGWIANVEGRYSEAEELLTRALEIRELSLGKYSLDTIRSIGSLADVFREQGHFSRAESLLLDAYVAAEQSLGPSNADTGFILGALANLYRLQGRLSEAEPLCIQAYEIVKCSKGEIHPDTAAGLNNLANIYKAQGRYGEAESLYLRSCDLTTTFLGAEHPRTAISFGNLARLYNDQGRYMEAEPLYLQSYEIIKRAFGLNHPSTATCLNHLAGLYKSLNRNSEAKQLYIQSLEITEGILGKEHPDTAASLNNLASYYFYVKEYTKAAPLAKQAVEISKRKLGMDHPDTATSLEVYAEILIKLNRQKEAQTQRNQARSVRIRHAKKNDKKRIGCD